jgi:hypothetical protein
LLRDSVKLRLDNRVGNMMESDAFNIIEFKPGTNKIATVKEVRDFFVMPRGGTLRIGKRDNTQQGCCECNGSVDSGLEHVKFQKSIYGTTLTSAKLYVT